MFTFVVLFCCFTGVQNFSNYCDFNSLTYGTPNALQLLVAF